MEMNRGERLNSTGTNNATVPLNNANLSIEMTRTGRLNSTGNSSAYAGVDAPATSRVVVRGSDEEMSTDELDVSLLFPESVAGNGPNTDGAADSDANKEN